MNAGWKPNCGQPIAALYAWIATEPDGGEGVVAVNIPGLGGMVPLVGADMDRMRSYRPYAEKVREITGRPIRLVRLSQREEMEFLP